MNALSQFAYDCMVKDGGIIKTIETTFNWGCDPTGENTIMWVIINITNWLSAGVVIVVIIMIVVGAIQYMSGSQTGSDKKTSSGLGTIRNAVIALGLFFLMWALINYLVPGGRFYYDY